MAFDFYFSFMACFLFLIWRNNPATWSSKLYCGAFLTITFFASFLREEYVWLLNNVTALEAGMDYDPRAFILSLVCIIGLEI